MAEISWYQKINNAILEKRFRDFRERLPSHGFCLFLGQRGSGKTSFLRFLSDRICEERDRIPIYISFNEIPSTKNFAETYAVEILKGVARCFDLVPEFPFPSDILLKRIKDKVPSALGRELELIVPAIISSDEEKAIALSLHLPALFKGFGIRLLIIWDDLDALWDTGIKDHMVAFIAKTVKSETPLHLVSGSWMCQENFYYDTPSYIKDIPFIEWKTFEIDETKDMVLFLCETSGISIEKGLLPYIHSMTGGNAYCISSVLKCASEMGINIESITEVNRLYAHAIGAGDIHLYWKRALRESFPDAAVLKEVLSLTDHLSKAKSIAINTIPNRFPLLGINQLKILMRKGLIRLAGENLTIGDSLFTVDLLHTIKSEILDGYSVDLLIMDIFRNLSDRDIISESEDRGIILSMNDVVNKMGGLRIPRRFFTHEDLGLDETVSFPKVIQTSIIDFDSIDVKAHLLSLAYDGDIYSSENERLINILILTKSEVSPDHIDFLKRFSLRFAMERRIDLWKIRNWIVSKKGFRDDALKRIIEEHIYSTDWRRLKELLKFLQIEYIFLGKKEKKDQETEYEIVIPVASEAETVAARVAEEIASRLEFNEDEIQRIKIALIEACINAFEHAFDEKKKVFVKFSISEDRLLIVVRNYGKKIDLEKVERGVMEKKLSGIKKRGWGIILMKEMMDEVVFEDVEVGTKLKLIKYRRKKGEGA
ncbi:MAG: ATP-binding protein [Candidatus Aenigmatarchaeota archaeon]